MDGIQNQGETAADIGGLRESFRGYKQFVRRSGRLPTIPGFNVTHYNLFFLSFAQLFCEKATDATFVFLASSVHPPLRYRINSAIQNTGECHKYYECPRRTKMNPAKRCYIWSM